MVGGQSSEIGYRVVRTVVMVVGATWVVDVIVLTVLSV